jgi:hypothetical protein
MEVIPPGAERINIGITSNPTQVRIQFDRMLNFIILPREHAIHFAMMVLEHAGASIHAEEPKKPAEEKP